MKKVFLGLILSVVSMSASAFQYGVFVDSVSQYDDLMPFIGPERNRTITIVNFSVYKCANADLADYEIVVSKAHNDAYGVELTVKEKGYIVDCMGPVRRHQLSKSTREIRRGEPIVIGNPIYVEQLPDVH